MPRAPADGQPNQLCRAVGAELVLQGLLVGLDGLDAAVHGFGDFSCGSAVGHQPQLWVQDVSGGNPRAITAEGVKIPASSSPVSPDGQFVFASGPEGKALYPIDGGPGRPIPGLNKGERLLRWSADGNSLYVLKGDSKIWLLDVATGKRRLWKELQPPGTATPDDLFFVLLAPDGEGYVQTYKRWFADLYVVEGLR